MEYYKNNPSLIKNTKEAYLKHRDDALKIAIAKANHFNNLYNFQFKKISIRNQKTRWGSCSKAGNLNFNFKIIFLPSHISDYIVIHELCHLKEMNHSKKFWNLVEKLLPNYLEIKKELRNIPRI